MVSPRRDVVAYHEAGHAVVSCMLGLRVKSVTIRPGSSYSGSVLIDRFSKAPTEKQILILLAGVYAQRRFAPHSAWRSRNQSHPNSGYDFDTVALLIHDEHGSGRVADLYSSYAFAKAEQLVEGWWQHIEAVAKALLERGTLTGAEMYQVMFDAAKTRPSR